MAEPRYWLGVVSLEHVQRGIAEGIAQLNHGKSSGLARMHAGDWLVFYSPRTSHPNGEILQAFTAIGQILSEKPYQVAMDDDFHPFRHDVRYLPAKVVPIREILDQLTFITDKAHWGSQFRFGHLKLTQVDFTLIAEKMGADLAETQAGGAS
jgi:hypothetical protein